MCRENKETNTQNRKQIEAIAYTGVFCGLTVFQTSIYLAELQVGDKNAVLVSVGCKDL